jgi:hypothetical protein
MTTSADPSAAPAAAAPTPLQVLQSKPYLGLLILAAVIGVPIAVPYLPQFWDAIGHYLPPRNGYILLRNSVYFDGNGITQALFVLLAYFVVLAVVIGILDWYRRPPLGFRRSRTRPMASAAAAATPAGIAT